MQFNDLPTSAQVTVTTIADRYDVPASELLTPREEVRSPEARIARTEAMCALADAKLRGRYRYRLPDIAAWFGVSRNSVYVQRKKSARFTPRRASAEKTHTA